MSYDFSILFRKKTIDKICEECPLTSICETEIKPRSDDCIKKLQSIIRQYA